MAVKIKRLVGRPTATEAALVLWGDAILSAFKESQEELDFVASGNSLESYGVTVTKRNTVALQMDEYLKYSIAGRGRQPGGLMPPINIIAQWLVKKGIASSGDKDLNSRAYLIARKQRDEGNQVYRGDRPGIPMDLIISESFDTISDPAAQDIAIELLDNLVKNVKKFKEA